MEGDITNTSDVRTKHAGVIPRSIHTIFDELQSANLDAIVKCSFMELYNEDLSDLLAERTNNTSSVPSTQSDDSQQLRLMENTEKGVLVQGLEEVVVRSAPDVFHLLGKAHARRRVAETLMNKNSSRSHCVFTITVSITEQSDEGEDVVRIGKLHLVDLAGSECVGRSGATAGRAVEAGNINKSLLTLGRVINALVQKDQHIPYRESKLTRLLQESLGGRAKTVIIATISPSSSSLDETLSTLDYAYRAKNIKNKPQINEKKSGKTYMRELQCDIQALKKELEVQRSKNGIIIAQDMYDTFVANSKSSSILINELEQKIQSKQEELATVEKNVLDLQSQLQFTVEQRDTTQCKLEQTEAIVVSTTQQLHDTEAVLDDTRSALAATQTTLKHTQFNVDTHKYVIEKQCSTEQHLTNQAKQLVNVTETVIDDKNNLHNKIDRLNVVAISNHDAALTFDHNMSKQLNDGKHRLKQSSETQINGMNNMMNTIQQHNTLHNQHSDNMIMSLSNELNTLQNNMDAVYTASVQHINSVNQHLQLTQSQYHQFNTTVMDKSLLLQSAVSTHNDQLSSILNDMADNNRQVNMQIVGNEDKLHSNMTKHHRQVCSEIEQSNSTQQQHSNKQITTITNVNTALQSFIAAQQQAADEQSQLLYNSIQSLIDTFKQQQITAMTNAVSSFMSQLQSTVSTERSHMSAMEQNNNNMVQNNRQFVDQQVSAHNDNIQYINTRHAANNEQLSAISSSIQSSAKSSDQAIDEIKSIHDKQLTVMNDYNNTHQQYIDTIKQQHTQQIAAVLNTSKQSVDQHISTVQQHNQLVNNNTSGIQSELQLQSQHINDTTNTTNELISSIGQTVHTYIHQQIQYDKPTGTTPNKRKFNYPTEFIATQHHPELKQSFAQQHSHRLQSEPHVPYQPVYTTDDMPRISIKRQSFDNGHTSNDSMTLYPVNMTLPSSDAPIVESLSSMSTQTEPSINHADTIDQENIQPLELVIPSRSTRSRGKLSNASTGSLTSIGSNNGSKMKQPSNIAPLSNTSNII